jgi:hypothetical protein
MRSAVVDNVTALQSFAKEIRLDENVRTHVAASTWVTLYNYDIFLKILK